MRNKMIKISTRVMASVLVAASVLSTATPVYAAENTAFVEEVAVDEMETVVEETPECEMTVPETDGQGDIIDDEFAVNEVDAWIASCKGRPTGVTQYVRTVVDPVVIAEEANGAEEAEEVEGQGDVIDDEFAYVEGQGDVIDDQFAVAPEAEVQPATESLILIEAPVIDVIMNEVEGQGDVIDDEFAYVEGQGDVIDDQFAVDTEVEGQGDIIDDEFAYVEGQGDVIDDQFAVTSEAEAAVEAVEVAENDTEVVAPSVKSFVAVGSAEASQNNSEEKTDNKSDVTKGLEITNDILNPLNNVYGKPICKEIDNCDVLGKDEKEMAKLFVKTGFGVAEGVVLGDFIPGFGAMRKGTKMAENFSKALDAKTKTEEIAYTIEGVKNFGEAVVSAFPGGGLVVAAANVKQAVQGYCVKKVVDFVKWLF